MLISRFCSFRTKSASFRLSSSLHTTAFLPARRRKDKLTLPYTVEFTNSVREVAVMQARPLPLRRIRYMITSLTR